MKGGPSFVKRYRYIKRVEFLKVLYWEFKTIYGNRILQYLPSRKFFEADYTNKKNCQLTLNGKGDCSFGYLLITQWITLPTKNTPKTKEASFSIR